jgi:hypothetical protein
MIPLNMRKYLRHIMTLPSLHDPYGLVSLDGTIEIDQGNLILHGNVSFQTLLAAAARVFIEHGFPNQGYGPYWESNAWLDAYADDKALVNSVAKESQEENFKQMTVLAVYDSQVPGFLDGKLVPEWKKFESMLRQIQRDAMPGALGKAQASTCEGKVPNERPGSME